MTKEEILELAAESNGKEGEFERETIRRGIAFALASGTAVCLIMFLVELFIVKQVDWGKPTIIAIMGTVMDLFEWSKIHEKKRLIEGVFGCIISIVLLGLYIGAFFL